MVLSSSLWAQANRACSSTMARTAYVAVPCARRSFTRWVAGSQKYSPTSLSRLRQSSSASALKAHPQTDVPASVVESPSAEEKTPEFASLKDVIHPNTLRAITEKPFQYRYMSAVQAKVFPLLPGLAEPYNEEKAANLPARDLLVKAKTGTGKTMAFLVPAIEARLKSIEAEKQAIIAAAGKPKNQKDAATIEAHAHRTVTRETVGTLIISPTRELACQIANEATKLTAWHGDFGVRLFVGGESRGAQLRDWNRGRRDIVVATPGRLRDVLTEEDVLRGISKTKLLILDEGDTLLDMGFSADIAAICENLPPPPERQSFLFSATISRAIQQIARQTMAKEHQFINCVSQDDSPVHAHIPQYHTVLPTAEHQIPHLLRLIAHDQLINPGSSKIIVFLPTTKMTQLIAQVLRALSRDVLPAHSNTKVYEIHSKRNMDARVRTSNSFRNDESGASILVTSDVSARGVDYPNVTRVIQIGVPTSTDIYVHRVGRTGRGANRKGRGDLILLPFEMNFATRHLTQVPIKPVTVSELEAQLQEVSKVFEENPKAFWPDIATLTVNGRKFVNNKTTPSFFFKGKMPATAGLPEIKSVWSEMQAKLNEDEVNEVFTSLLGYYAGRIDELGVSREAVVEGCKTWTVEALGLPVPPFVGANFLEKLGLSYSKKPSFNSRKSSPPNSPPHWLSRGSIKQNSDRSSGYNDRQSSGYENRSFGRREGGYGGSSLSGISRFGERREGGYGGGSRSSGGGYGDNSRSGERREGGFRGGSRSSGGGYGGNSRSGERREGGYGSSSGFGERRGRSF